MPNFEVELNPVDFITVGTVGPRGQRVFYLQAAKADDLVTVTIEKEQAFALSEALRELVDDLDRRYPPLTGRLTPPANINMDLRDPVEPRCRIDQMGLGYDEDHDLVVLVAQELVSAAQEYEDPEEIEPGVIRLWCSRSLMRALSDQAMQIVQAGRPDPRQNGRLVYYWT